MLIKGISLQSFRSFSSETFLFDSSLTYIVGKNTAGKTNILEAITLLSTGKSFRGVLDREMISFNSASARIKGKLEEDELEIFLSTGFVQGVKTPHKKYFVNGVSRRSLDAVGVLKSVLFAPEDVELVTGSPSLRRNYLDMLLSQADREYRREASVYEKGLRQRNKLLFLIKEGLAARDQLGFWNTALIRSGNYMTQARQRFLHFCSTVRIPTKQFTAYYDKSEISVERLQKYSEEEIHAKTTLVGPHRDNFVVHLQTQVPLANMSEHGVDVSVYGSRGEQRLSVLWLKLAALEFIVETTGQKPVLLLDDIFSELDAEHQQIVLDVTSSYQTIITSADPEKVDQLRKVMPGLLIEL